ncbi:MAG: nucleoside triphosphate pyrophosphohydrolase [Bacteroidetes bacterium]|nr:MAG: nucleoside triphosphate pyrophosphohydrolase [Bacteroidota bacterium]
MDPRLAAFERLLTIMDELREQCPWDKKQTLESLRTLTIEETYELADAILDRDDQQIASELGDLFLHLVFYSKIGSERGTFDVTSVLNGVCEKLIHRHPHIYGDVQVKDEEEVKANWEKLKLKEGKRSVLEGVPKSLPALVKANRIQDKVKGIGFDWDEVGQVWDKLDEEIGELREAFERKGKDETELEFGDVLFSLVNISRYLDVNPENALERTNQKFIKRFMRMEELCSEQDLKLSEMKLEEMDRYWEQAKLELREKD